MSGAQPKQMALLEVLLCLSPLLVLYETATFAYSASLLSVRYPRPLLFCSFGLSSGQVMWGNGLLLLAFCLGVAALYRAPRLNLWGLSLVVVEGLLWSAPFLALRLLCREGLFGVDLGRPWPLFAGAAFYDALAFQWLLPALFVSWPAVNGRARLRVMLGVLLPSLLYTLALSWLRHPGAAALVAQLLAALMMNALAWYRGFPCAAYAQLGYTALGVLFFY